MTYDQAQSPRLGQPTPVESTFVRMFTGADIPEASWHGQMIFRSDLQQLQIYDMFADEGGAWRDVTGGVYGHLTYVGPDKPPGTDYTNGDTWYDTDDNHRIYVWDGTQWSPSFSGTVTRIVAQPGMVDLDTNPDDEVHDWHRIPPTGIQVGDVWYETDAGNLAWTWNGNDWIIAQDTTVLDLGSPYQVGERVTDLNNQVEANILALNTVESRAEVVNAKVTMSDWDPGLDDAQSRENGAIWFTRTRSRKNYSLNPSFEKDIAEWSWNYLSKAPERVAATGPADGTFVLEVTNDGTVNDHYLLHGAARFPCTPDEPVTVSAYTRLVTGAVKNQIRLHWYDGSDNPLPSSVGAWVQNTTEWDRPMVTAIAPATAASYWVMVASDANDLNGVWQVDGVLIEQDDDLGRYFDGDSYDGHWDEDHDASSSSLEGTKITRIWELWDNSWIRKYFTDDTLNFIDAGKLSGTLSGLILTDNTVPIDKMSVSAVKTSTALTAGDLVNVFYVGGEMQVRQATAAAGSAYEAHGFVLNSYPTGVLAKVYHNGYNPYQAGMASGNQWLSPTTAGKATNTPPKAVNQLVQRVGFAASDTLLNFSAQTPIRIT